MVSGGERVRFFAPGPVWVAREVLEAQVRAPVPHRGAEFRQVWTRIGETLPRVFRTERPVVVATGSATLLMESAVASTVRRRVLNLVCGAFSERWHAISRALGRDADRVEVPYGEVVDPGLVRQALRRADYEAVTVVHCETSSGALSPLSEIAAVIREESDALVLVDAVSSLGGARVETDAWGLDVVLTASQKALALPPGLSFAAVSARAEGRMAAVPHRGFYTDLQRYLDRQRAGGPVTTPAETLVFALERQLERILDEGIEERWERHQGLRDRVLSWASAEGLEVVAAAGFRSPTVTALVPRRPDGAERLLAGLAARGFTVGAGYGELKGRSFRIGHLGEVGPEDLEALLAACTELLEH